MPAPSTSAPPPGRDQHGEASARRTTPPFALLAAVTVTALSAYTLVPPALPDLAADLHVDPGAAGLVLTATTMPGIVLAPLIGALVDRLGRRELLAGCLLVFGLGGGTAAMAPGFAGLVGLRLLQGIGAAGLIGLVMTLIGDSWAGAARTRMMGRNSAALTAALVVLPPLGGTLTELGGWRLAMAPYPVALLVAVAVLRLVPSPPPAALPAASLLDQCRASGRALAAPGVGGVLVRGALVFLLMFGLVFTVLPEYLARTFGVGPAGRGLLLALVAVPSIAAALALGRLTARFGPRALLVAGFAAWTAGFTLIAGLPGLSAVVAGLLVYGVGDGLLVPTLQTTAAGTGPAAGRAAVVAVFVAATRAGQSAGPAIAGVLLAGPGPRAAFAAGAVIAGLLATTVLRSKRT